MDNPPEALLRSKVLKEEGNKLFRSKACWLAVNMYDKSLQYLYVLVLENEDDANAIEELGISINWTSCLLAENELFWAKRHCDLVIQIDLFNIKARFRRAKTLINMGLRQETCQYLLVRIRFDPKNEEIRKQLSKVEELCNNPCRKNRLRMLPIPSCWY